MIQDWTWSQARQRHAEALGLLTLRVSVGSMMLFGHGLSKLERLGQQPLKFADPLGIGAGPSLGLAAFAEVVCAALLIAGLWTRLAATPLLVTMLVAAWVVHGADPWVKKELALMYAWPTLALMLTGPGRWSIDAWWAARRRGGPGGPGGPAPREARAQAPGDAPLDRPDSP